MWSYLKQVYSFNFKKLQNHSSSSQRWRDQWNEIIVRFSRESEVDAANNAIQWASNNGPDVQNIGRQKNPLPIGQAFFDSSSFD